MSIPSTASINASNIPLSPVQIVFNGVDLGATEGGVTISLKTDWADIMADQGGKTPYDKVASGQVYSVKTILSEMKNKAIWKVAFPYAYQVMSGTGLLYFQASIGTHLLALAQTLKIHPLEMATTDYSADYNFYKAACASASEIKYGPDKQSGLQVEFIIFPDTTTNPPRFFTYGDPSNGIVQASAAAAVPGSNTGNGTLTAISVTSGITKTETITATCVGVGSGGTEFFVKGSLSGALGAVLVAGSSGSTANFNATTGSPAVIGFTLTQGSTEFAVGDSFTVATTAANFA